MKSIYNQLRIYCEDNYVPMHMPGHKRNYDLFSMENPYKYDITEIDGFDNLHNPQGILMESMEMASHVFGAKKTYYLVNGSSIGILAGICGATKKNDRILVARNSHKSVYNAIYMNELNPVYINSQENDDKLNNLGITGRIYAEDVERTLSLYDDISAAVITSPTYEGMVSDIEGIAELLHKKEIPLIVDEAHGAHFNFSNDFPDTALQQGADIVIQSIHKTLPAFTQTALMHVNEKLVNIERVKHYLDILQSTSPSYILMAGIDQCVRWLNKEGETHFKRYVGNLKKLREQISHLNYINIVETDDISKIVLYTDRSVCHLNGRQFYDILLEKYHVQLEMASEYYVIAMTSVADRNDYYIRLLDALKCIDDNIGKMIKNGSDNISHESLKNTAGRYIHPINSGAVSLKEISHILEMNIYDAVNHESVKIELCNSSGFISGSTVCVYPPGIPVVNPGERITDEIISFILNALETGLQVIGLEESEGKEIKIRCLK